MAACVRRPGLPICTPRSDADPSISFTIGSFLEQPRIVRWFVALCSLFLFVAKGHAQHQEPSLVDRLLRPNMELQNDAQGKKFAANSAVIEKRGTVGTFVLQSNRTEKSFADTHALTTTEYRARPSNVSPRAITSKQAWSASTQASLETSSVSEIREAPNAHRAISGSDYAAQRRFAEQGKSQKSLDRQNPPLSIDQVRELLNKNK
jgi:hypothetical protein